MKTPTYRVPAHWNNEVPEGIDLAIDSRHLVNGDSNNPPLIPYLVGDFSQL